VIVRSVRAVGAAVYDHSGEVIGGVSTAALVDLAETPGDLPELVVRAAADVSRALGAY
jgi:DNA-binding IclR family transcriptional regulator